MANKTILDPSLNLERYITLTEAARLLGVSRVTYFRYRRLGAPSGVSMTGDVRSRRVRVKDVLDWAASRPE
jgi:LmbE family N-acetylglucosaminyl deacetylase